MRWFMLLVGLLLVVVAMMLMGADMVSTLEMRGQIVLRTVGDLWKLFDAGGPDALRAWGEGLMPGLLPAAIDFVLGIYGWAVIGIFGVVVTFLFSRKRAG